MISLIAIFTLLLVKCSSKNETTYLKNSISLTSFTDKQEESPSLVTDRKGNIWLFTLKRNEFPDETEFISAFKYESDKWEEMMNVTQSKGQFEAPVATCASGGKPVIAWTQKEDWSINVALFESDGFSEPHSFVTVAGHSINPVLIAPNKNRNWVAWENLHNGIFTIRISKYENSKWSEPIAINKQEGSCFSPAMAESKEGNLYIAYGYTKGFHQNIELAIIDRNSLSIKKKVPIAIGGGHENRVNINSYPALAFDKWNNLWISFENNRNTTRMEDGDNYTGDRCCAILSYQDGKVVEVKDSSKWLFKGKNDQNPTFIKDTKENLYLATYCGSDFTTYGGWKYRLSWLDANKGWQEPVTIYETKMKGFKIQPAIVFNKNNNFWLAAFNEQVIKIKDNQNSEEKTNSRRTQLNLIEFKTKALSEVYKPIEFTETKVKEFMPDLKTISTFSGHPKLARKQITINSETYYLLYGNLHEHTNSSNCWPAGNDGSKHDDYRFGMYSEGYDFVGLTDHAASTSEIHWRRNLRMADFYNESDEFVAIPGIEWTLQPDRTLDSIQYGVGHYNIIFKSTEDAKKYIRNKYEIYSPHNQETKMSLNLWQLLTEKNIECVTIPHHTADDVHYIDWSVHNPEYVTAVEIFQCRGNSEHPACPREKNLSRHNVTHYKRTFVDYALRDKKYKMGFIASGDHNSMGIGLAALWVKEVSRAGILEALKNRRTFATTGDKIFMDVRINGATVGESVKTDKAPELNFSIESQSVLDKVEVLRNSKVIHEYAINDNVSSFTQTFIDKDYKKEKSVLYYYIRVSQKNNELAWSSPIWVEKNK